MVRSFPLDLAPLGLAERLWGPQECLRRHLFWEQFSLWPLLFATTQVMPQGI